MSGIKVWHFRTCPELRSLWTSWPRHPTHPLGDGQWRSGLLRLVIWPRISTSTHNFWRLRWGHLLEQDVRVLVNKPFRNRPTIVVSILSKTTICSGQVEFELHRSLSVIFTLLLSLVTNKSSKHQICLTSVSMKAKLILSLCT